MKRERTLEESQRAFLVYLVFSSLVKEYLLAGEVGTGADPEVGSASLHEVLYHLRTLLPQRLHVATCLTAGKHYGNSRVLYPLLCTDRQSDRQLQRDTDTQRHTDTHTRSHLSDSCQTL